MKYRIPYPQTPRDDLRLASNLMVWHRHLTSVNLTLRTLSLVPNAECQQVRDETITGRQIPISLLLYRILGSNVSHREHIRSRGTYFNNKNRSFQDHCFRLSLSLAVSVIWACALLTVQQSRSFSFIPPVALKRLI